MARSDGGPSNYYDFPKGWITFNDFLEYKSAAQWLEYSFHLGNIGKVLCRWGDKEGTENLYDTKKIIYSGCRIFAMIAGTKNLRQYLVRLLDDPQFKDNTDDEDNDTLLGGDVSDIGPTPYYATGGFSRREFKL